MKKKTKKSGNRQKHCRINGNEKQKWAERT